MRFKAAMVVAAVLAMAGVAYAGLAVEPGSVIVRPKHDLLVLNCDPAELRLVRQGVVATYDGRTPIRHIYALNGQEVGYAIEHPRSSGLRLNVHRQMLYAGCD